MSSFAESHVEAACLEWLRDLGYEVAFGPEIAPEGIAQERESFGDVVLLGRLREAARRLNPSVPAVALEDAVRRALRHDKPSMIENNREFHQLLVEGVPVEYRDGHNQIRHDTVRLIDFTAPQLNDFLAVNQFTVVEGQHNRRPDVVVFVNGVPLAVIELKNAADENTTLRHAYQQLQTYKLQVPSLFLTNALLAISDGLEARVGSLTSDWERFQPWRTADGESLAPKGSPELETLVKGVFDPRVLLDLVRNFVVFEDDGAKVVKKLAAYHQYWAVNKAVGCTVNAASPIGDRRIGVVWHTQGSGKSLSMVFYAGKVVGHPLMENPTLVVLTDRNDLDEQLFGTFSRCSDLLRQAPVQAFDRAHLRELLSVASGGVIFTTIQKFAPEERGDAYPVLTERRNVVVIADESHRSQYGFNAKVVEGEIVYGYAKHLRDGLPHASYIGFTGTPIESNDRSTTAVFGDTIDVYDIARAVEDGATVPIYYEGRLAKIGLDEEEKPKIDSEFEEVTEGEEENTKRTLQSKWARLEAMVGADKRIKLIARDLVEHFERRLEAMDGKGMVVCMSRRICHELYEAIRDLRPEWHGEEDETGSMKVVMTGSATDPLEWQGHIRSKPRREKLAQNFRDPSHPFRLVIVRDMWLTGFDCPPMHTMYVDKPMKGHGLMQALARVNRVFKDKPGGLVVDYLGLADQLRAAMQDYTVGGGRGETTIDVGEAVAIMEEKYDIVSSMLHGHAWEAWREAKPTERLGLISSTMDFVIGLEDGVKRFVQAVTELGRAFALAMPQEEALEIREDVAFFQAVRAGLVKTTVTGAKTAEELDQAVRQIVQKAVVSGEVIDVFAAAGLRSPDISILSDEFLDEVRNMPRRNLALEMLRKLLNDEIRSSSKRNLVQAKSFAEMLERSIRAYQNRSIETAQVIAELVELAKEMRQAQDRGERLGLTDDEVAFYDALEVNDSAVMVLGDDALKAIAREIVDAVRRNVTIDWTERETVKARLRSIVKRILRKHGYPPDKQAIAVETVVKQAELIAGGWAA